MSTPENTCPTTSRNPFDLESIQMSRRDWFLTPREYRGVENRRPHMIHLNADGATEIIPVTFSSPTVPELCSAINSKDRITIVGFNEIGFPFDMALTVEEARVKSYAQYPESLYIVGRAKGKRKTLGWTFTPPRIPLIFEGWFDVDEDWFWDKLPDGSKRFGGDFDPNRFLKYIDLCGAKPFHWGDCGILWDDDELEEKHSRVA